MIINSSDEVTRFGWFKRFPVPRNFNVTAGSRIERGRTWPAPAGATRTKTFEIYRYDPDSGDNPRLDRFHVRNESRWEQLAGLHAVHFRYGDTRDGLSARQ